MYSSNIMQHSICQSVASPLNRADLEGHLARASLQPDRFWKAGLWRRAKLGVWTEREEGGQMDRPKQRSLEKAVKNRTLGDWRQGLF